MTPNEHMTVTGMGTRGDSSKLGAAKSASIICLLAGIWFFVSPWIYGAEANANAWNSWIIGGFIVLFGILRIARPAYSTVLSWCNMILGIWAFFSPWIYGYTSNNGRFINSLCVGVIVFVFSIASAMMSRRANVISAQPGVPNQ
jgi:hypothetical protein